MTFRRTSSGAESTPLLRRFSFVPMEYNKSIEEEMGKEAVRRVSYNSDSHTNVLCQVYGSAWPKVLPYCLLNMAWICFIEFLRYYTSVDISFHSLKGFSIMGILVSKHTMEESAPALYAQEHSVL